MEVSIEQRYSVKYCFHFQNSPSETVDMIRETFNDQTISMAINFRRQEGLKEGMQNVEDIKCEVRTLTSITETKIKTAAVIIKEDNRITVC